MTSKRIKLILFILATVVLAGTIFAYSIYFSLKSDAVSHSGHLYLNQGITYETLLDSLSQGEVEIKNLKRFDRVAGYVKLKEDVRPGHYHIKEGTSYLQLARMLQRGWQTPIRITFNNIRTLPQLAGRISRQLEPDSLEFVRLFTSDTISAHYGHTPESFISMFIPDTYEMYWTAGPNDFLDRMQSESDRFWNDSRESKRAKTGLSRNEVIALASIVYEETAKSDEMPRVAGVYINRIKKGMLLQADPTVKFAVGDFGLRRILFKHLEVDSPYNTYKYAGIPPGPICMPSVRAIDAVLDYEIHGYYYFCADEKFSGYHNFARTLTEHNRNAARYQQALNQRGIR